MNQPLATPAADPASGSRAWTWAFCVAFFVAGLVACLRYDPWRVPFVVDNQHYFFLAERAASGVPPHVSHFDPKHMLSVLISAAAIKVSRVSGIGDDVTAARAISIAFAATAPALAWLCVWLITRRRAAACVAGLVMLSIPGFYFMAAVGARPKVFLVPFLLAPVIFSVLRRPFWAGVFGACAFLTWQPGAVALGGAGVALLCETRGLWRRILLLLAGAALPVLAYEGYFVWHGALAEQIEQAYHFPRHYLTHDSSLAAYRVHAEWLFRMRDGIRFASIYPLGAVAVLAAGAGYLVVFPRAAWSWLREQPGWVHAGAAMLVALAFTLHDYQGFPDAFLVRAYVGLFWGGAAALGLAWLDRVPAALLRNAVVAVVVLAFAIPPSLPRRTSMYSGTLRAQYQLAAEVESMIEAGRSVYAIGCTHLLALIRRDNHNRFGFFFRGMQDYMPTRANAEGGFRPLDARGRMPDVILESRGFIPGGKDWLTIEYREVHRARFKRQGIRVFERIGIKPAWG